MTAPAGEDPASGAPLPGSIRIPVLQALLLAGEGQGISLQPEEIELIRLIDLEGLEQEEAAEKLGVSRKTAWRDLHEARRKIADALVNGKGIEMAGCTKAAEGRCPKCPRDTAGTGISRIFF